MVNPKREHLRRGVARRIGDLTMIAVVLGAAVGCVGELVKARVSGNEASAIASLRTIVSAQIVTAVDCNGRFKPTLTSLGATGNLSPDLGVSDTVQKAGYIITMTASGDEGANAPGLSPACQGTVAAFTATAVPIEPGKTGQRYFITDQKGEVRQATSAAFTDATPLQ